jgi:hypothetical protein
MLPKTLNVAVWLSRFHVLSSGARFAIPLPVQRLRPLFGGPHRAGLKLELKPSILDKWANLHTKIPVYSGGTVASQLNL